MNGLQKTKLADNLADAIIMVCKEADDLDGGDGERLPSREELKSCARMCGFSDGLAEAIVTLLSTDYNHWLIWSMQRRPSRSNKAA